MRQHEEKNEREREEGESLTRVGWIGHRTCSKVGAGREHEGPIWANLLSADSSAFPVRAHLQYHLFARCCNFLSSVTEILSLFDGQALCHCNC